MPPDKPKRPHPYSVAGTAGDQPLSRWVAEGIAQDFAMQERSNRAEGLEDALQEIADADPVDLALDPNWPQRIAAAALKEFRR